MGRSVGSDHGVSETAAWLPSVMRYLLAVSLLANAAAAAVAMLLVSRRGGVPWLLVRLRLRPAPRTDYAAIAAQRFAEETETGGTMWWGDSLAQNVPLLRVMADARNWGIGGQVVADLAGWTDQVIAARPERLVIVAGTNDLGLGYDVAPTLAALGDLLADLRRGLPAARIEVAALPPLRHVDAGAVEAFNAGLPAVATAAGCEVLDDLADPGEDWTDDGTHFTRASYLRQLGVRASQP